MSLLLLLVAAAAPDPPWCVIEVTDASGQGQQASTLAALEAARASLGPLVSNKKLKAAAQRLRIPRRQWSEPAQLKRLAAATGCEVAISAQVSKGLGRWMVLVTAMEPAEGTVLAEESRLLARPRVNEELARSVLEQVATRVRASKGATEPPGPEPVEPAPVPELEQPTPGEPDPFAEASQGFGGAVESLKMETTIDVGGRVLLEHFGYFESPDASKVTGRDNIDAAISVKATHPRATAYASLLFRHDFADTSRNRLEAEEAWIETVLGPFTIKAGRMLVSWGSATLYSPSDVLNPFDFRDPLRVEKWGTPMIKVGGSLGPVTLELMYLPVPELHRLPVIDGVSSDGQLLSRSRWLTGSIDIPDAVPLQVAIGPMLPLPPRASTTQLAGRVELAVAGADIGVAAAWVLDRVPSLQLSLVPAPGVPDEATLHVDFVQRRVLVLAADAERAFGRFRIAAEGAAFLTANLAATNPYVTDPYFIVNAGGDVRTGEFLGTNQVHLFLEFVVAGAFKGALATDGLDLLRHPFPNSLLGRLAYDTGKGLRIEVGFMSSLKQFDIAVLPRIEYSLFDRIKLQVGVDLLRGEGSGFSARFRDNSRFLAIIEARY